MATGRTHHQHHHAKTQYQGTPAPSKWWATTPYLSSGAGATVFGWHGGDLGEFWAGVWRGCGGQLLVLCFVAKAWELYEKRDAYVALNLALFTLASAFLIRQDLSVAVVGLPTLMMILLGFIAISDDDNADGSGRLRVLAMITLPAIPLLVVLFLFFPRLPPMWSLPMAGKSATTGVSDSMSPGDFSNLSQSTELAFRAEFDGQMPSRHEMYWRGLVFSDFDGGDVATK